MPKEAIRQFYRWLEANDYHERTIRGYSLWIGRWVQWCADQGISIFEASDEHATEWVQWLRKQPGRGPENIRQAVGKVRGFYQFLVARRKTSTNPFNLLRLRKRPARLPADIPTTDEIRAMLSALDGTHHRDIRNRVIVELLYAAALRRSELRGLDLADINWDRCLIHVRQGKGYKDRVVPVYPAALERVQLYVSTVRQEYLRRGQREGQRRGEDEAARRDRERALLLGPRGNRISGDAILTAVKDAAQRAGIKRRVWAHLIRHATGSHLHRNGMPLDSIKDFMGHETIRSTEIYLHTSPTEIIEDYRRAHPLATAGS